MDYPTPPNCKNYKKNKAKLTWLWLQLLASTIAAGILFLKYGILLPSLAARLMATSSIIAINVLSLEQ